MLKRFLALCMLFAVPGLYAQTITVDANPTVVTGGTPTQVSLNPAFPAPPPYANSFANLQTPPSGSSWTVCAGAFPGCGGGSTGSTTLTSGVASINGVPTPSGAALEMVATPTVPTAWSSSQNYAASTASTPVVVNYSGNNWASLQGGNQGNTPGSGSAWWKAVGGYNSLAFLKLPCAISGNCGAISQVSLTFQFFLPSSNSNIQAYEWDPDFFDNGYEYQLSMQCDVAGTGTWRPWGGSTNSWVTTRFPCSISTGVWHTMQMIFSVNTINHTYTAQSLSIDGVAVYSNLGLVFNAMVCGQTGSACAAGQSPSNVNFQFQIDFGYAASGANAEYIDKYTAYEY